MTALQLPTAQRPQLFSDLVGQDSAVKLLTSGIINGNLGPVVLCSGPRGSGKTSSARLIAKALNCRNRSVESAEPCGTCSSCKRLSEPILNGRAISSSMLVGSAVSIRFATWLIV